MLREQLGRAAVHLELRLQLPDPLAGRGELLTLPGSQAGDEAAIDALLASPGVDRLLADPEVTREVDDLATRREQVEHPTAELGRVSPSSHGCLLVGEQPHDVQ